VAKQKTEDGEKRVNKMKLVRDALATLGNDAMPNQIADHIKAESSVEMSPNMVSNYKSSILKKLGLSPRRRGRRRGRPRLTEVRENAQVTTSDRDFIKDVRTIREIADRLGINRLRELVELLH
jgi:hypothetical protein